MIDLVIIGCSAAATAAGIYAARQKLDFKIIAKDCGGNIVWAGNIANYPGFPQISGMEMNKKFMEHLKSYDIEPEIGVLAKEIKIIDGGFSIIYEKQNQETKYEAKAVILATGLSPKKLDIPGEKEFLNKGVSYCTVCDGPVFSGKTIAIIGGKTSALEAGLMMASIAKKVFIVTKYPDMKGEGILVEKAKEHENIEIVYNALVKEIYGDKMVKGIRYTDIPSNQEKELELDGVFVHVGMTPNSQMAPKEVEKDKNGFIVTDKIYRTNVPGFFAAGDVADIPYNQIGISVGEGIIAALSAIEYLNIKK